MISLLTVVSKGSGYYVAGSNVGVQKTTGKGYYNPDVTVVKGQPAFVSGSNAIITNPYLVVEIFSESTAAYDLYYKLPKYEQIDLLQGVTFVDRFDQSVMIAERTDKPNAWLHTHYYNLTDVAKLDRFTFLLSDLFADLPNESQ